MNYTFTTTVDMSPAALEGYTDEFLAYLWACAQFNAGAEQDLEAGRITETVGREIIRRWLASVPPSLWKNQGTDALHAQLRELKRLRCEEGAAALRRGAAL